MLARSSDAAGAGVALAFFVFLAVWILAGLAFYGIFKKAGKPGWAAFVPIYNLVILLEVVGRPIWWLLLLLIPFVNIVVLIIVYNDLSKSFGKGAGFTVGLIFLNWIFLMILGFGSARYGGPAGPLGASVATPPPPPPAPA